MHKTEVKQMFDRISPAYDRLNTLLSLGLDCIWRKQVLKSLPFTQGKILDCCTGTGELAFLMARHGHDVTGIDISTYMLDIAEKKKRNGMRARFLIGNAEELPFPDRSFQAVTSAFSLRNLGNLNQVFQEAYRILLQGGTALFLDLTCPDFPWLFPLHRFYLTRVLPGIGGWISGDKEAYRYLGESILNFPTRDKITNMLESAGFSSVKSRRLSWGIATLWQGTK